MVLDGTAEGEWGLVEVFPEEISCPLNAVKGLLWKHLQSAKRDPASKRGVLLLPIILRNPGDNDLDVALGTQGSAVNQSGLAINAPLVDIAPCLHIVEGVEDNILGREEVLGEDILGLGTDLLELGL